MKLGIPNKSIVTKVVAWACGIVAVFLLLGSIALILAERRWEQMLFEAYRTEIQHALEDREAEERALLEKNLYFNMEVLSQVINDALFDFDFEAVKLALGPYMRYPEIVAIQVLDENGEKIAAAWKTEKLASGEKLPETFAVDATLSFQHDVLLDEDVVGQIQVYYSDAPLRSKIQTIRDAEAEKEQAFRAESQTRFLRKIFWQISGMFCILLALMLCLIIILKKLVLKPLQQLSKASHELAGFDLTVQIEVAETNEIGGLCADINTMADWFRTVLSKVQHVGSQVASSSNELSATAKQQEVTMGSQLESTRHVQASAGEISELATTLVESMRQVGERLQEAAGLANKSQSGVSQMETAMQQLEDASKSISHKLENINEKAEKISTVVTTIDKVSEQTNLLSLNAAIEAEKAGEYGRGFAVVAREIRRLADRTAVSTLDIGKMVQEMQSAVSSGIMEMDKFISEVRNSAGEVETIGAQLKRIIEGVQILAPGFERVNEAMGEQSGHTRKINKAMQNLSEEMRQTKMSLQETYQAIGQLNEAAQELQTEVSRFKVME